MPRNHTTPSTSQDAQQNSGAQRAQSRNSQTKTSEGATALYVINSEPGGESGVRIRQKLSRVRDRSDKVIEAARLFMHLRSSQDLEAMLAGNFTDEEWKGLKRDLIMSVIDPDIFDEETDEQAQLDAETKARLAAAEERDRQATAQKLRDMEAAEARRLLLAYKEGILKKKGDISSFDHPSTAKRTLRKIVRTVFG